MKLIYIGGPQGAGKTTVTKEAASRLRALGHKVLHFDSGQYMREYVADKYPGKTFTGMPHAEKIKINREVKKGLLTKFRKYDLVLVTSHFAVPFTDPEEYVSTPAESKYVIYPAAKRADHFILFDSSPRELKRRLEGSARHPHNTLAERRRSFIANRLMARYLAEGRDSQFKPHGAFKRKVPLTHINNKRGQQEKSIEKIVEIANKML